MIDSQGLYPDYTQHVLLRISRSVLIKNEKKDGSFIFYEAWRDKDCYINQIRFMNGQICNMGFFFCGENKAIEKFIEVVYKYWK